MKKRKYQDGDRVTCPYTGKPGVVVDCINAEDSQDLRIQGFRYTVEFLYGLRSITETELMSPRRKTTKKIPCNINTENKGNSPSLPEDQFLVEDPTFERKEIIRSPIGQNKESDEGCGE